MYRSNGKPTFRIFTILRMLQLIFFIHASKNTPSNLVTETSCEVGSYECMNNDSRIFSESKTNSSDNRKSLSTVDKEFPEDRTDSHNKYFTHTHESDKTYLSFSSDNFQLFHPTLKLNDRSTAVENFQIETERFQYFKRKFSFNKKDDDSFSGLADQIQVLQESEVINHEKNKTPHYNLIFLSPHNNLYFSRSNLTMFGFVRIFLKLHFFDQKENCKTIIYDFDTLEKFASIHRKIAKRLSRSNRKIFKTSAFMIFLHILDKLLRCHEILPSVAIFNDQICENSLSKLAQEIKSSLSFDESKIAKIDYEGNVDGLTMFVLRAIEILLLPNIQDVLFLKILHKSFLASKIQLEDRFLLKSTSLPTDLSTLFKILHDRSFLKSQYSFGEKRHTQTFVFFNIHTFIDRSFMTEEKSNTMQLLKQLFLLIESFFSLVEFSDDRMFDIFEKRDLAFFQQYSVKDHLVTTSKTIYHQICQFFTTKKYERFFIRFQDYHILVRLFLANHKFAYSLQKIYFKFDYEDKLTDFKEQRSDFMMNLIAFSSEFISQTIQFLYLLRVEPTFKDKIVEIFQNFQKKYFPNFQSNLQVGKALLNDQSEIKRFKNSFSDILRLSINLFDELEVERDLDEVSSEAWNGLFYSHAEISLDRKIKTHESYKNIQVSENLNLCLDCRSTCTLSPQFRNHLTDDYWKQKISEDFSYRKIMKYIRFKSYRYYETDLIAF